jgi:hypothetical protein
MYALFLASALVAEAPVAEPSDPVSAKALNQEEAVICRRDTVTGSRAKTRRTCMTAREWERSGAKVREGLDEFLSRARNVPATE